MQPNGTVAFQPFVIAPATVYVAPEPVVMVPETYVVVGEETFGFVGGQYVYLGAGNVWLVCDSYRLERFHGWERDHPDWREHAIRNEIYRRDAQGHEKQIGGVRSGEPGHGEQHPNVGPGQTKQQQSQQKGQPQQKQKNTKKTDKDQKPQ
jgi:hypothetical protein